MIGDTPLAGVLHALGLRAADVVRVAADVARQSGLDAISRRHFGRLLSGDSEATAEKIYIVTAAMQELSGVPLRAADLFRVEPAMAGVPQLPVPSLSQRVPAPVATDAFEKLYTEYGVLLRAIAIRGYHVPPDDAEELVHDTFMAFLQRHTYIRNVKGWLSATVRNRCMNYLRDRREEVPLAETASDAIDPSAQESIELCIRRLSAAAVIAQLGEKCRETLRGHYLSEESMERIADRLLISREYVERLVSRCRRRAIELYRQMVRTRA